MKPMKKLNRNLIEDDYPIELLENFISSTQLRR